jgi:hypothetical protein
VDRQFDVFEPFAGLLPADPRQLTRSRLGQYRAAVSIDNALQQATTQIAIVDDGAEHSERYYLHKVMRAIDLSRMLSAAMQQLRREGELTELELMLARNEFAAMLEQFRRRLAAEIAARMTSGGIDHADVDLGAALADGMLEPRPDQRTASRRWPQPGSWRRGVYRRLRARLGPHRRSLQAGGVPRMW